MNEKPLYDDNFLKLGEWMNSATVQLIIGFALALALGIYVHWIASLIVIVITVIGALACFMVIKK